MELESFLLQPKNRNSKPKLSLFQSFNFLSSFYSTEVANSGVVCKKVFLKISQKITEKYMCESLFYNKVTGLRPVASLKKRFWQRCFPVNFAKYLRTIFL